MSTSTRAALPGTSPLPDIIGLGGAIAGLIGGLAMALVAAIISAWLGGDIWLESKQIAAITGMSLAMVEHYSKGADQLRLARQAMAKLEGNGPGT